MKERFDDFKEMVQDNLGVFICLVLFILIAIGTIVIIIWAINNDEPITSDSMSIANPANPISPLNPINPANPINHIR